MGESASVKLLQQTPHNSFWVRVMSDRIGRRKLMLIPCCCAFLTWGETWINVNYESWKCHLLSNIFWNDTKLLHVLLELDICNANADDLGGQKWLKKISLFDFLKVRTCLQFQKKNDKNKRWSFHVLKC